MPNFTVQLEFWMGDRLGWDQPGPIRRTEPLVEGDSLRTLFTRLAERSAEFAEAVFDPGTQSLSSEVLILINDHIQNVSQGLETKLQDGDRIKFLPILAGG